MKNLYNLSIKELVESIDENISDTKETRKKLVIGLNQEKDAERKAIKKALIEKCDKGIFRFEMQKSAIEEIVKEHAVYGYEKIGTKPNEKTAQEGLVQEQLIKEKLLEFITNNNEVQSMEVFIYYGFPGDGRGNTCSHIILPYE
ncbi:hypothetical protein [Terrisporobacter petrolearius]|uniref:hypothetical protein n=1 Tax=Terrisporobacter petrolearius TaxID=1460447 RepID=UPI0031CC4712